MVDLTSTPSSSNQIKETEDATTNQTDIVRHSVNTLIFRSLKRTHDMFIASESQPIVQDEFSHTLRIACKVVSEYSHVKHLPPPTEAVAKFTHRSDTPSKVPMLEKPYSGSSEVLKGRTDNRTSNALVPLGDSNSVTKLNSALNKVPTTEKVSLRN